MIEHVEASPDEIYDIELEKSLLDANAKLARENRAILDELGITAFDCMGAIGSGKTTLISKLVGKLKDRYGIAVFNGDATTTNDADLIAREGIQLVQIATVNGCHLDANLVQKAFRKIELKELDLIFIENIGNLICPALSPSLISKLRKAVEAPPPIAAEKCDFCGSPIPAEHRHFADLGTMRFLCACEMCAIIQVERGIFRPLPQRYLLLENFKMPETLWQEFMIPVEMAFFVFHSARNKIVAFYPAPTGATESQLNLGVWEKLGSLNPILQEVGKDLEALLVNRTGTPHEYYIVPIDSCYQLVGAMRASWQGISGGQEAFAAISRFFREIKARCSLAKGI
ncbi:MAG: hydrogenase nickel incorporation protein HypB [bacterium]